MSKKTEIKTEKIEKENFTAILQQSNKDNKRILSQAYENQG